MLKRHQVLLTDWQTKYLKLVSKEYGISFSEAIRALMSLSLIEIVSTIDPKYKPRIHIKKLWQGRKKLKRSKLESEEFNSNLATLYFEARKALEHRERLAKKNK